MTSSHNEPSLRERCQGSLENARGRRLLAARERRRKFRLRGGGASIALVVLAIAVVGGGAAVAQQVSAGGSSGALLREGSRGPTVKPVQRALGMPASAVDGVYGSRTTANVRLFQRRHGLLVDGITGPQTRGALGLRGAASASGQASSAGQGAGGQAQAQTPSSAGSASGQAGGPAPGSGSLQRIAQCESGGNPRAIGGNGQYRGKYQFTRATWRGVGGSGDPAAAPEAEQDRRAAVLYERSGSSNWPTCGS